MDSGDVTEDKDSGPDVQINFPNSVTSRIEELMGGIDQFDSADFDPIAYINRIFPTEQSLSGVEGAAARCEFQLAAAEADARRLVRAQPQQRRAGQEALEEAHDTIARLAKQVADINVKAERSEAMVREITAEIKQLDCAKANLTAAITALNHYHMLAGGIASLAAMTASRQYKEVVLPLQAIMEVLQHFECYSDIREINALRDRVHEIRCQLATQIQSDFKEFFSSSRPSVSPHAVSEACHVVDVLDPKVKRDLLNWFIDMQLQEYTVLFSYDQEASWVCHVERRYAWLKKHLLAFEESRAMLFPEHWRLSERTAHRFCKITHSELSKIMSQRRNELDVKLLLHAIQKTHHFECLLHKRFIGTDIKESVELRSPQQQSELDMDYKESESDRLTSPTRSSGSADAECDRSCWIGLIGSCFEPYLYLYIASLDANLRQLMDRFIQDARADDGNTSNTAGVSVGGGCVISSCADLFLFYKKCLVQCASLTTGQPMLELAGVFQKYLREYASNVLGAMLPRQGSNANNGPASIVTNLQTLLRDDASNAIRYTDAEIAKIASVITTAEYCVETSVHLELKLKEKVSPSLSTLVDFQGERRVLDDLIAHCVQLLVQDLESLCAPHLQAMWRVQWTAVVAVGDQSPHVSGVLQAIHSRVPKLRDHLNSSRKYFTQFCIRFASSFIPRLVQALYRCKVSVSVTSQQSVTSHTHTQSGAGAEQLLLDTHTIKTALLEMPNMGSDVKRPAPHTYTKVVIKLMTKAEMILKLVMAPLDGGGETFVSQVVQLLPDCTLAELHKLLEMKGARLSKSQLQALDTLFKEAVKNQQNDQAK